MPFIVTTVNHLNPNGPSVILEEHHQKDQIYKLTTRSSIYVHRFGVEGTKRRSSTEPTQVGFTKYIEGIRKYTPHPRVTKMYKLGNSSIPVS